MFGIYLIIGAVSGTLAGLLGTGGGIIVVPALATVFELFHIMPKSYAMHMAVGTSLAAMIITLTSALRSHLRNRNVRLDLLKLFLPGLIIGSLVGAVIAHELPSSGLRFVFIVFLLFLSARLLFMKSEEAEGILPSKFFMRASAVVIGFLSSILGAGGGSMLIPFMLKCNVGIRQAAGTSVVCGIFIGLVATVSFMFLGIHVVGIRFSTGYIYWPAFIGVSLTSMLFAPIGISMAQKMPSHVLKRIFGIFLLLIAISLFLS